LLISSCTSHLTLFFFLHRRALRSRSQHTERVVEKLIFAIKRNTQSECSLWHVLPKGI